MPERPQERRKMSRLFLRVLVKVEIPGSKAQIFAETRNVSAQGIYFCTQITSLDVGQELSFVLVLPEKMTLASQPTFMNCRGRILRLTPDLPEDCVGVALEINSFDFSERHGFPCTVLHHA
jgi:PilZ domain